MRLHGTFNELCTSYNTLNLYSNDEIWGNLKVFMTHTHISHDFGFFQIANICMEQKANYR